MNALREPIPALLVCIALLIGSGLPGPPGLSAAEALPIEQVKFFESQVRPLLADRCFKCHGEDKQRGNLRLDSRAGVLAGGESGPAVTPGEPDASLLLEAVRWESFEMPPDGRLPDSEVAVLAKWVEMGAPWPGDEGKVVRPVAPRITDEDRAFWSFQPVRRVPVPRVQDDGWCLNPIDHFILRRLREEGLSPAAPADRRTLIRRATFDLLGIPPTPEEVRRFLADESPQAYARLIDGLLERPEYGERWARHWLDLVRYAESDGFRADDYRPGAWRYRDYVIQAFNEDKPYDRFVQEQLAGDELWPGDPQAMIATSLLRHGIYEFNQRDVRTQWDDMLNDITDVTADVFLGLGMSCARCHDHKFDPILQEDYFRLRAFFAPLLPRDDLPLAEPEEAARYREQMARWEEKTADIRREIAELEEAARRTAADAAVNKFPLDIRPMLRKDVEEREPLEHQLAELAQRQVILELDRLDVASKLKGEEKQRWEQLKRELAEFDDLKPKPLPAAFTVTDVGPQAPPTRIPGRRDSPEIEPGFLTILDPSPANIPEHLPASQSTGRRTALARWLTDPDNPLPARVIVNRIWQQHFGRGLVATSSDFGTLGEPPTHPELLDWLAAEFVEQGWSLKRLHRLIMNSATYRQAALRSAPAEARMKDPENRWLWRMPIRRLDAEQIRDAMLAASGELDSTAGGPSVEGAQPRRSIYIKAMRNNRDPLLAAFDVADGFASLPQRNVTTTPTQSLLMINGPWTLARAQAMAGRLRAAANEPERQVELAFWNAYGRPPSQEEKQGSLEFLQEQNRLAVEAPPLTTSLPGRNDPALDLTPGPADRLLSLDGAASSPGDAFTIEATVLLRSLYPDAAVRTIAAQWDGSRQQAGWSLGVTSEKSAFKPRNLILQFVGPDRDGKSTYEVIASNLHLELNTPYHVAAVVRPSETGPAGVTFYLRASEENAQVLTAEVKHRVVKPLRVETPFTVGGRAGLDQHQWDGLIDDLRLSDGALPPDQLLLAGERPPRTDAASSTTVGYWTFDALSSHADAADVAVEDAAGWLADRGGRNNDLTRSGLSRVDQALADLCHALLNSNEFLYVD